MNSEARMAAVRDLAEYGIVYVNTLQETLEVVELCPVPALVSQMSDGLFRIEELKVGIVITL